ncbi:MAG: ATP-binding protein [Chloroflexota bacterium]
MSRWLPIRRDLGLQLLALYLAFVAPVIAAAVVFDTLAGTRLENDVKAADLALAQSISLETDTTLRNALNTVLELSQTPEVQSDAPVLVAPLFAAVSKARSEINLVYLLDASGIMVYHYPEGPSTTVGTDFSFRGYFKAALTADAPLMSIGRVSPTTNQPVTTAVMPIRDGNGVFKGVVATNLALERLSSTLARIAAESSSGLRVSILDASRTTIADSDVTRLLSDGGSSLAMVSGTLQAGKSAFRIDRDDSGREWLRTYVPIPSASWTVVVERPTDIAFASPRLFHDGLLIASAVFLAGGLLFWIMLSRRVLSPLERLAEFSRRIGYRDEPDRPGIPAPEITSLLQRGDQIGHLTRALKLMEDSVERRFTELATLLETSRATSASLDAGRVIDTILEQVQRLMAVNTCALLVLDEKEAVLRVRASRGLSDEYARELRIDPHDPRAPAMRAIASERPVQVPDTETDVSFEPFRARASREGYRSILAVPLIAPHIGPSALVVYRRDPHVFSHDEIELIWNFANHAAIALENAALYSRTDERLQEQTRVLESVMQSMSDGLLLHDHAGRVLFVNRLFADAAGSSPAELEGQSFEQVRRRMVAAVSNPASFEVALAAALDGSGPRSFEFGILRRGQQRDIRARVFDVVDPDGRPVGQGELFQDITRYRELDRMKSSLISTVSHELRTPLASIKGYASTLQQDDVEWDSVSIRNFAEVMSDETDRLTRLVNDLLDMSRIEGSTLRLSRSMSQIREIVPRAIRQVLDRDGHTIEADIAPDLPPVEVDTSRIEAVIRNLIENAVKYSRPGTPVRIRAEADDRNVTVKVSDLGPGVAPEHRGRVFERFYRADASYTRDSRGAGLGLAICKGFVEAHGGTIWLEEGLPGATFAFTLPLPAPDGARASR